jgi:hypothetical protein
MSLFRRVAALAFAAPPATNMWALGALDMADLAPGKTPTYIISLQLKKDFKLPAKIAVPLPTGADVVWSGEVFFSDPSLDVPSSDAKIVKDGGKNYLVFTMKTARAVQIECTTADDMIVNQASIRDVNLYWDAPKISGQTRIAIVAPTGFKAKTVPADVTVHSATDGAAYVRTYKKTTDGQRLQLSITLVAGQPTLTDGSTTASGSVTASAQAAAAATASAATTAAPVPAAPVGTDPLYTTLMAILVGGLAIAVGVLVWALMKQKKS